MICIRTILIPDLFTLNHVAKMLTYLPPDGENARFKIAEKFTSVQFADINIYSANLYLQ